MNKKTRLVILVFGFVFLLTFYFFSREVKGGFLKQVDFDTTVRLQDRMPKRFDGVWEDFAFFVEPMPAVFVVGLLTIAAFVDCLPTEASAKVGKNKSAQGGSALGRKIRIRALIIPLLFGLLVMGEIYGKSVVHHPAPSFFMIKNSVMIFPKYYVNEEYSYPSGHTARATFFGIVSLSIIAGHVSLIRKQMKKWLALGMVVSVYILIVAIGKVYLGQHWISDVIGGGLLGTSLGLIAVVFR